MIFFFGPFVVQTVFDNETSLYSPLKTPFSLFLSLHILSGRVVPTEHVAEKNVAKSD